MMIDKKLLEKIVKSWIDGHWRERQGARAEAELYTDAVAEKMRIGLDTEEFRSLIYHQQTLGGVNIEFSDLMAFAQVTLEGAPPKERFEFGLQRLEQILLRSVDWCIESDK
jgi:hypothetical protein